MKQGSSSDVVMRALRAVEERDERSEAELFHPEIELHWPPSLRYRERGGWTATWDPFQGAPERRLDPRLVAASDDEVVVLWQQRGRGAHGERLEVPVLGLYRVHEHKLARGEMFYFDTVPVIQFLESAQR